MKPDPFRQPLTTPSPAPATGLRKRSTLQVILFALLFSAALILILPLKLPLAARLAVAGGDLLAAIMVGFVLYQSKTEAPTKPDPTRTRT